MDERIFSIFNNIQNFFTIKNIDGLKRKFIKSKYNKEDPPFDINHELGILKIYNSHTDEVDIISFDDSLRNDLSIWTNEIKLGLDVALVNSEAKRKISNYANTTFKYILSGQKELFEKHPICKDALSEIKRYLTDKHALNLLETNQSDIIINDYSNSIFKVKYAYSKRLFFVELYDLVSTLELIDDEEIYQENFINAFTLNNTSDFIKFNTETGFMAYFLKLISPIFNNFNGKIIEQSERFLTKQNKVLSQSNYNTSLKRIKDKDNEFLLKIDNSVKDLISKYSV